MSRFQLLKLDLVAWTGLPKDALHICVGMAVFLLAAALLRRKLGSALPIAAVLAAAFAGEAWDLLDTAAAGQRLVWGASGRDILTTAFWPAALFLLARYTRLLRP